tara:strand:+ start:3492 stop:3845 length:354 start_codon:yes stop_codon:yes gene_type:complete
MEETLKTKEEYIEDFKSAIREVQKALAFDRIDVDEFSLEELEGSESKYGTHYLYAYLTYQVDDRIIEDTGMCPEDTAKGIKKALGKKYGVSGDRIDAYPNGYAAEGITFDAYLTIKS